MNKAAAGLHCGMSFGLARGRGGVLDASGVGVTDSELGPLPDAVATDPRAGRVDPRAWFAEPRRALEIEVGCGKGTFLLQEAARPPHDTQTNFLGIEWAREFALYGADRVRRRGMTNVRVLNADAAEFLHWRVPDGIVRVIHLYFPDPWPKRRHHRRRIVQERFLADCWRALVSGGELRIFTDHDEYWGWMQEQFAKVTGNPVCGEGGVRFEREEFGKAGSAAPGEMVGTNFERKYRREGRPFHGAVLRRVG